MTTRLLAINPNTSNQMTDAFVAAARAVAPEGVEITGVTGTFGARVVSTEAEGVIAAYSALELAARHAHGYDGVVLAISFDSALVALQQLLPMPVSGISAAALAAAGAGGRRVGGVIFGEPSRPLYEALIATSGVGSCPLEVVELTTVGDYLDPQARDMAVLEATNRLAEAGAEAVVIFGAAIVGMAGRLSARARVPLYDGTAGVGACLEAIAGGAPVPARPTVLGECVGTSAELSALIEGSWPTNSG